MTRPALRGLLFDKDGTLFDFQATWGAWAVDFIARFGRTEKERAETAAAIGFDTGAGVFLPDSRFIADTADATLGAIAAALPYLGPEAVRDRLDTTTAGATQVPVVDLAPFLDGLRDAGIVLGIATNDAEAPARAHLRQAGVEDRFAFIAGFDSGFGSKPAPGQMHGFLAATSLAAAAVAMVGDSTHDLMAGRAAGMVTVAVLTGVADAAELAPHADVVLESIADLPGWLHGA